MLKPKHAEKWIGSEDLSVFEENFIFEVTHQLRRCEILIANGILEKYHDDLFLSALTEFLVTLRSLIWKYHKLTSEQETDLHRKIILFRNALCHTDSKNNTNGKLLFQITAIPANADGTMTAEVIDGIVNLASLLNADDIVILLGGNKLFVRNELLPFAQAMLNYFWGNLPSEHELWKRSQQYIR